MKEEEEGENEEEYGEEGENGEEEDRDGGEDHGRGGLVLFGVVWCWCCLMTPGLSKDIRYHI